MNKIATYKKTALSVFGLMLLTALSFNLSFAQTNVLSAANGGEASQGGGGTGAYGPSQYLDGVIVPYNIPAVADFGYVNYGSWIKMYKVSSAVPPVPTPFSFNKIVFHKGERAMTKALIQVWDNTLSEYVTVHNYENYLNFVADSVLLPTQYTTDTIRIFNATVQSSSSGSVHPSFREIQVWDMPPCAGTPAAPFNDIQATTFQNQTPAQGTISTCFGTSVFLGARGSFYSSGHGYQWQINKGGSWQDIPGANGPGYVFYANFNAQFRVVDTCLATGSFGTSNTITVNVTPSPTPIQYQTIPYFQGFESWSSSCALMTPAAGPPNLVNQNDLPGPGWVNNPAQFAPSWRRWATPAPPSEGLWSSGSITNGVPGGFAAPEGTSAARFWSYGSKIGVPGSLDLYLNLANPVGDKQVYFRMLNPNTPGPDSLVVSYSTDSGFTWTRIGAWDTAATWQSGRRSVPLATNSPTTILRFQATRYDLSESTDIFIDSLYIVGPCSGTPLAGTINLASPQTPCPGSVFSLNPIGTTMAGGLIYTWERSLNGGATFEAVPANYGSGANNLNFTTPSLYDTVHFRLKVQCGASGTPVYTNTIEFNVAEPKYAAIPYSQSFETWVSQCSNSDVPESANGDINFANIPATGNPSWRRRDQGATASWTSITAASEYWLLPNIEPSVHGNHAARFHSNATTTGVVGNLDLLIDASTYQGDKELNFFYINRTGNDSLRIFYSNNGGGSFTRLAGWAASGGWVNQVVMIPSDSPKTIIRFQGFSEFGGTDIAIDSVRIIPPCNGTPFAGTITDASPCPGVNFMMQLQGTSIAASLSYQWQQSTNGTAWTNIPNATTTTYSTNISVPTYYRVIVTCGNSSLSDTTAVRLITPAPFYWCYCESYATSSTGADIGRFEVQDTISATTLFFNGTFTSNNNNNTANKSYSDFRNLPPIKMYLDSSYRLMVHQINSGNYVNTTVGIWIDTSMNGIFEPNEQVLFKYPQPSSAPPQMVDDTITIPANAKRGITGLRIVMEQGINPTLAPCGPTASGETEDYLVEIMYPPCDGPTNPGTAIISDTTSCVGYVITVIDTTHEKERSNISWVWEYSPDGNSWAVLAGSQMKDTMDYVVTGPTYFRLRMICNRGDIFFDTTYSNIVHTIIDEPWACYCFSQSEGGANDSSDIGQFEIIGKLLTSANPVPPGAGPHLLNPAAYQRRTDYTGLPPVELWADSTYQFKVFHIMRGSVHHDAKVTIFMDFNNDFEYDVTPGYSELVYTGYTTQSTFMLVDQFTVPHNVVTGIKTGMRVILNDNIGPNVPSDSACGTYISGETEDYVVIFQNALDVPHLGNITQLSLYPNPTEGRFSLSFRAHKPVHAVQVTVTSITGQKIAEQQYTNAGNEFLTELDLTELPRGMYLVELKADNEKLVRKVVLK